VAGKAQAEACAQGNLAGVGSAARMTAETDYIRGFGFPFTKSAAVIPVIRITFAQAAWVCAFIFVFVH